MAVRTTDGAALECGWLLGVTSGRTVLWWDASGWPSGQERFTDTWVQRAGRWQCVAMHCSKIVSEPGQAPDKKTQGSAP